MKKVRTPKDLFITEMTLADASNNMDLLAPMNLDSFSQKQNKLQNKGNLLTLVTINLYNNLYGLDLKI